MTKTEIITTLKKLKPKYEQEGLVLLGLFGSYSRDEANESSDIDILYRIGKDRRMSMFRYLKYLSELEQTFHHKVDLVRDETLKPDLKPYVEQELIRV